MVDEAESQLLGDLPLQALDHLVFELDHAAGLQIDQVVVVVARHLLVARPAVAEIVPSQDVGLLEQPDSAIDRGDADARVDLCRPLMHALDIGVVG